VRLLQRAPAGGILIRPAWSNAKSKEAAERTCRLGICVDLDNDEAGPSKRHDNNGHGYSKALKDEPPDNDDNDGYSSFYRRLGI
jgi:hypothetical protein